jgi:carbamoyl-phosphate synthase large subunit
MKPICVGISGINAVDNPGPGIGVARSLREDPDLNVKVVGLAYDAMEPGLFMDWVVDRSYLMPYPSTGADAYLERLLYIKKTCGLDCIIPNLDAELPLYIKWAPLLAENGIATFLPTMEQFKLRSKDKLVEFAPRIGLKVPRTKAVNSLDAMLSAAQEIGYPVMVKGCFYKAFACATPQEAIQHFNHLVAEWGYPIIVQEIISGGDEVNAVALGDGLGHSLGIVGIKKVGITALGKIWTGVTIKNEAMLAAAEKFIEEFQWRGPFELECIVRGDDVYLIEINPRFPAWTYFATGVGVNLPSRLVHKAMQMQSKPLLNSYDAGKLFVRYSYEMVTEMTTFQQVVTTGETAA